MSKHHRIAELVTKAYEQSKEDFGQWIWQNHVPVVAKFAEELSGKYGADADLAVAGAWLHDFGDAFMYRFSPEHEETTKTKAREVLQRAEYSDAEAAIVMDQVIAFHSCRDGNLPSTLEGKVLATADALAHLSTDFYVQLAWKHIPEGKSYSEFTEWVRQKLERDFTVKIFFEEEKERTRYRYEALKEVFKQKLAV